MSLVLIIGGAGFIGSNLAHHLCSQGQKIKVLDNLSRGGTRLNIQWLREKHPTIDFINADIRNLNEILPHFKDVAAVYHVAAQVAVMTSLKDPTFDFQVNALGTLNVLEAIRKSNTDPALVFTSTNKVYGDIRHELRELKTRYEYAHIHGVNEMQPAIPCTPYGCSKAAADFYVQDYAKTFGLKNVVFRMSCIYGRHQFGNEDQGWVAHFVISSILDKPLVIYGDGKQVRDVLFVDDLVNAFQLATEKISRVKGNVYNIGGGPMNTLSLLELISLLEGTFHKKIAYTHKGWRPSDQKVYYTDISKAKKDMGWEPRISRETGVGMLIDWVTQNIHLFR